MKELLLYGPVNSLGYGIHFTNFASSLIPMLKERDVQCGIIPVSQPQVDPNTLTPEFREAMERGKFTSHKTTSINLWHQNDMAHFTGGRRIGYPVFEMEKMSAVEQFQLSQLDEIWVVSQWAKDVIKNQAHLCDMDVHVVPEGVNSDIFCPGEGQSFKDTSFEHTFVSVGKMEKRKGFSVMLEAFKMFLNTKNIKPSRLLWHCYNPFLRDFSNDVRNCLASFGFTISEEERTDNWTRFRSTQNKDFAIDVVTCLNMPTSKVAEMYQAADTGIFASFAEGWNLPLLEAMSSGLPCIANMKTGPTEYLTESNSLCIQEAKPIMANDGVYFHGNQGNWYVPKISSVYKQMLYAVSGSQELEDVAAAARETALKFSWDNAARQAVKALEANGFLEANVID